MVAATVPRLDFVPVVNLSRAFLHRALEALEAGRVCEAGVLLRESVRRQCYAECAWKGCLPKDNGKRRSPMALLESLKKAGHVGYCGYEWTKGIIDIGNKCAHCITVDPSVIRFAIATWHESIDHDPCGETPERKAQHKPQINPYDLDDCDDDDGANWWKGGAA